MRCTLAFALLSFSSFACQDYLFQRVEPERVTESRLDITIAPTPADILFVVDNSGSMADEQDKLAASFDRFIRAISESADRDLFHIGIVTTDLDPSRPERAGFIEFNFGPPPYEHWDATVKSSTCETIDPPLAHACFRGPIIRTGEMTAEEEIASFKESVGVGSCGSGAEQGLNAMIRAVEQMKDGACNDGFLREDANLVVIVVSDEDEATPAIPPPSAADLAEQLAKLKPLEKTRFAAVVGAVDGVAQSCRIDAGATTAACGSICMSRPPEDGTHAACTIDQNCPSGQTCQGSPDTGMICENALLEDWAKCSSCSYYKVGDCCSADAGHRYVDFARELERRVTTLDENLTATGCRTAENASIACLVDSICQENFGDTLAKIAEELVVPIRFKLEPPALNPAGVTVRLKGGRFGDSGVLLDSATEFEVSADGRWLELKSGGRKPMRGETVEIHFVIQR